MCQWQPCAPVQRGSYENLNDLATVAPDWRRAWAPLEGYDRYSTRIEDARRPREQAAREAYAQMVGEDGFAVLDALEAPEAPEAVRPFPRIATLRRTWQRHYERPVSTMTLKRHRAGPRVRFKASRDFPPAAEGIESPSDPEARYRHKRDTQGTGSLVHGSETYEPTAPHPAEFGVGATAKQGRKHDSKNFAQERVLTLQAPFDLGDEVFRKPQVIERLLEGLGSLLRLAVVTCETLLSLQAAPVSGFGMFFGISFGWGHGMLQCAVWDLLGHAVQGLPAFFCRACAVYIRPYGLANSHTVF